MTDQLRAEVFKLRTTRSTYGMLLTLLGLVTFAVVLHGLSLPVDRIDTAPEQMTVLLGWGERFGVLVAALAGAMSVTAEFRHGTIRPTFLVAPRRTPVVLAKVLASTAAGLVLGVIGGGYAAAVSAATLTGRGVDLAVTSSDVVQLVAGTALAAALWAAIGVGLGALVRGQVPTLIGVTAWLLLLETLVVESLSSVGRFLPGAAAKALTGQSPGTLLATGWAAAVLALYAAVAVAAGWRAIVRRDVA